MPVLRREYYTETEYHMKKESSSIKTFYGADCIAENKSAFSDVRRAFIVTGRRGAAASGALAALVYALLGLLPRLGAAGRLAGLLGAMALLGLASGILNVSFSAAFMEHVDGDYMARISGLTNAVLCSMMPVCSLLLLLSVTRSRGYRGL